MGRCCTMAIWAGLALAVALPAEGQERHSLADVAFLTGCWAGTMGDLDMREQWTSAEGGMMLGTTRYLKGGRIVDFEFARLVEADGVVTLWPYPRGSVSEHGFPLVRTGAEYVFENLAHDFPVRIIYVRSGPNELTPRIEGNDGTGPGWALQRAACESGG